MEERDALPLAETIASVMENQVEDAHLEKIPLAQLVELLARLNARAGVLAMDGEDFLERHSIDEQKTEEAVK